MPRRNGNERLAGPRPEVSRALRAKDEPHFKVPDVPEYARAIVREHPFASLALAALAGFGAGVCLRAIAR